MSKTAPPVFIILLNYNGWADTLACLKSLQDLDYPQFKTIVVDNASTDDSLQQLTGTPYQFELLRSSENLGYSGGNNIGIQLALDTAKTMAETSDVKPLVWILNNDTTVKPDALKEMVWLYQQTKGMVGSMIRYPDKRYQQVGHKLYPWTGGIRGYHEGETFDTMPVMSLSGASMLVPVTVFETIGLLDESFFLYCEDVEFCLRAQKNGIKANVALDSIVYHHEGATTGQWPKHTQYYYQRNRVRLFFKHYGISNKISIALYSVYRLSRAFFKSLISPRKNPMDNVKILWLGFKDGLLNKGGPCPHEL